MGGKTFAPPVILSTLAYPGIGPIVSQVYNRKRELLPQDLMFILYGQITRRDQQNLFMSKAMTVAHHSLYRFP